MHDETFCRIDETSLQMIAILRKKAEEGKGCSRRFKRFSAPSGMSRPFPPPRWGVGTIEYQRSKDQPRMKKIVRLYKYKELLLEIMKVKSVQENSERAAFEYCVEELKDR